MSQGGYEDGFQRGLPGVGEMRNGLPGVHPPGVEHLQDVHADFNNIGQFSTTNRSQERY